MNGRIKTQSRRLVMWLLVCLVAAGCVGGGTPEQPAAPTAPDIAARASLLQVDEVVLLIAESYPAQVVARVIGSVPDSCSAVDTVRQTREGARVRVTITTRRTAAGCGQAPQPMDLNVRIDGGFTSGEYIVLVNGVERRFSI